MKEWLGLFFGFIGLLVAVTIFMAALLFGAGAFTPYMNPLWYFVTAPVGLAVAAAVVATCFKCILRGDHQ